ncbi:kita-kyushu lung cancer antigen 1 homolog [Fukomys damarensis]|uniref:kita-kyushu lung cancer antigen 1 homolog n=1 Tax=Fukomys damarensis TaxID=885580 RepID=UPI00053F2AA9|nr:kita-kyushu lung cancer antigen 1 homolog [Fukomys damarensis]
MSILLFLLSGAVFAFICFFWKNRFHIKRNTGEMSSNSTALALVKRTTISSSSSSTDSPSVYNLSQDILNRFPQSMALRKRILVNLRVMQHHLTELEQLLILKGLNGELVNPKSTKTVARDNESTGNQ